MKILHIIRSVNPESGGPIEAVIQLSLTMQAQGHTIEILSLDSPDNQALINECPLKVNAAGPAKGVYGYSRNFIPWLEKHESNYDAFIINGIWQYQSFATHKVLKEKKRPYYLFTHGMLDPWFKRQYPLKHLKKYLYWYWGEYPVIRDAAAVLFTCEEERILARQSFWPYRCNEIVVNFGTAGHIGDAKEQKQKFFEKFPSLRNGRFLLYLSRIHPKKGVDLLIEAFAKNLNQLDDLQLVIAGPDQVGWQNQLQDLANRLGIANRITWTGMLKGDLKWGAYYSAEAFILPSHQENFGIVVAESLSCSLPVLISDKVNIWHEIANADAGLIAADTLNGCHELIEGWINLTSSQREALRHNALNCFRTYFEIGNAAKSLLTTLQKSPRVNASKT
ncbi:glycosyltransferase [Methylomonas sp. DH-1]|uniref:glycosyltransferase n=1 Tax=Methylomonas sp. (strain DH-1) TaxID=1727196 RepID=UPI0007C91398|nr:glycosyltransferase [Methylomonas sp. DH-1]ANE53878.1 transferase [Methylomonas sp. DH-1]